MASASFIAVAYGWKREGGTLHVNLHTCSTWFLLRFLMVGKGLRNQKAPPTGACAGLGCTPLACCRVASGGRGGRGGASLLDGTALGPESKSGGDLGSPRARIGL